MDPNQPMLNKVNMIARLVHLAQVFHALHTSDAVPVQGSRTNVVLHRDGVEGTPIQATRPRSPERLAHKQDHRVLHSARRVVLESSVQSGAMPYPARLWSVFIPHLPHLCLISPLLPPPSLPPFPPPSLPPSLPPALLSPSCLRLNVDEPTCCLVRCTTGEGDEGGGRGL